MRNETEEFEERNREFGRESTCHITFCWILTLILLKLSFRGHQESELVQNNIADRMAKHRQLDLITQQLLQQDEQMMKRN